MSVPSRAPSQSDARWIWPALALLVIGFLVWRFLIPHGGEQDSAYRTEPVVRGEIRTAISATGTLSATATVEVGTQVSGTLKSVEVDFNDVVRKDQVIARIDPSTLEARLEQASATLGSTRAGLGEAQAVSRNAELDYQRKADLVKRQLVARADADQSLAARDQARARIASANAQVRQQQASVDSARLELEKSVIRSPVDGVVLLRSVEPGQTVAASLQTPVLFKIAGDLRKMEISLAIDEADIGQVREGMAVRFTVDAFPDRNFTGRVKQVRLSATNTANVITYPVLVEVENQDQTLLPGMTANAEIEVSRRPDVLSVPNAALRFRPAEASESAGGLPGIAGGMRGAGGGGQSRQGGGNSRRVGGSGMLDSIAPIADRLKLDAAQRAAFDAALEMVKARGAQMRADRGQAGSSGQGSGERAAGGQGSGGDRGKRMAERLQQNFAAFRATLRPEQKVQWDKEIASLGAGKRAPVYRLVDGKPEQVTVGVGATDGTRTELHGNELKEGDLVIVGSARPAP